MQVAMRAQMTRERSAGRAAIEQHGVAILDMQRGSLGDRFLLFALRRLAFLQRRFRFMRTDQRSCAAIRAHETALLREHGEIASHRRLRYPQRFAQLLYVGIACEDEIEDGAVTVGCFHRWKLMRITRPPMLHERGY